MWDYPTVGAVPHRPYWPQYALDSLFVFHGHHGSLMFLPQKGRPLASCCENLFPSPQLPAPSPWQLLDAQYQRLATFASTQFYLLVSTFSLLAELRTCTAAPRSPLLLLLSSLLPNGLLQPRLLGWAWVEVRTMRLCLYFQVNLAALRTHNVALPSGWRLLLC